MIRPQPDETGTAAPPANIRAASADYYALLRQLAGQADSPVIRSLGVTSSRTGEGVSTIALHCALAAEQLFRQPILLVEANLRQPSLARVLQIGRGPGLAELLLKAEQRDDCLQNYRGDLFAMTAGSGNAKQLAGCTRETIAQTVDALQEGHRLTVWDLPPVGESNLGIELASQLDGILLVVEAERVHTQQAQQATDRLRSCGAKLLGAVLNKEKQHLPRWLQSRI